MTEQSEAMEAARRIIREEEEPNAEDAYSAFDPGKVARALLAAAERIKVMVTALEPFVKAAKELDDDTAPDMRADDDMCIEEAVWNYAQPTVGDLRTARKALEQP